MTVVIDGRSLTVADMVAVGREHAPVALAPAAIDSMRRLAERSRRGRPGHRIYGVSTAAGALQRVDLRGSETRRFNRLMLQNCRVGLGPPASREIVRGTLLRLANNLARGITGVRPELAQLIVQAVNEDWQIEVRILGSVGQADLVPMSELMTQLLDIAEFTLEAGEGMAVIDNNAFSTAIASFAFHDLERLADALDVAAALEMEGYLANPSTLHRILSERPYAGLARVGRPAAQTARRQLDLACRRASKPPGSSDLPLYPSDPWSPA